MRVKSTDEIFLLVVVIVFLVEVLASVVTSDVGGGRIYKTLLTALPKFFPYMAAPKPKTPKFNRDRKSLFTRKSKLISFSHS